MNNRNVAHNWANQTGKNAAGSHFYALGPGIFSYGPHFEIARHVKADRGGASVVLFTTRGYSSSTAKHKNFTRSACSHLTVFAVPSFTSHEVNGAHYLAAIEAQHAEALRSRKYGPMLLDGLRTLIAEAEAYRAAFRVPAALSRKLAAWARRAAADKLLSAEEAAEFAARIVKAREYEAAAEVRHAEERKARAAAQVAARAETLAKLQAWAQGAEERAPESRYYADPLPVLLRVKGAAVETSLGAVVSVRAARVLWAAIKAGRDIVGADVDGYAVRSWNGELIIGCHKIARAEVERVGALLDNTSTGETLAQGAA